MLCGTDGILWNTVHIQIECGGIFHKIMSIPQNTVISLNNVM